MPQLRLLIPCFLIQWTGFEHILYKHDDTCIRTEKYQLQLGRAAAHAISFLVSNSPESVRAQFT
jgi:hypothetical protein